MLQGSSTFYTKRLVMPSNERKPGYTLFAPKKLMYKGQRQSIDHTDTYGNNVHSETERTQQV